MNDSSGITSYHSQEIEHYDFRTREYPIPLTTHRNSSKQLQADQAVTSTSRFVRQGTGKGRDSVKDYWDHREEIYSSQLLERFEFFSARNSFRL